MLEEVLSGITHIMVFWVLYLSYKMFGLNRKSTKLRNTYFEEEYRQKKSTPKGELDDFEKSQAVERDLVILHWVRLVCIITVSVLTLYTNGEALFK